MAYKEIDPSMWKPENDGDFVEGILVKKEEGVGENKSMLYNLETSEGLKTVWGSAILDSRMTFVKVGAKVKITFKGLAEKTTGKNPAKIFKVEVDEED